MKRRIKMSARPRKLPFRFASFVTGFSSVMMQIVVLREAITGFYGDELTIAIILSVWFFLIGIGALLLKHLKIKRSSSLPLLRASFLVQTILAPLTVFIIRTARVWLGLRGVDFNPASIFFYTFFILAPFSLISGWQFSAEAELLSEEDKKERFRKSRGVSKAYLIDSIGDVTGAFTFTLLVALMANSFYAALIISSFSLLAFLFLHFNNPISKAHINNAEGAGRRIGLTLPITVVLLFLFLLFTVPSLESLSTGLLYSPQRVVRDYHSRYGNLVVTEDEGALSFYENSLLMFTTENELEVSRKVYPPLLEYEMAKLRRGKPKNNNAFVSSPPRRRRILLISGGLSGTIRKILDFYASLGYCNVANNESGSVFSLDVDYVELDPLMIRLGREMGLLSQVLTYGKCRLHLKTFLDDGVRFLKYTNNSYNVIIVDLPNPTSLQINRFYTSGFFSDSRKHLENGGVLSLRVRGSANYMNKEELSLNRVVYATLSSVFRSVLVIPGVNNHFLASMSELSYEDYQNASSSLNLGTGMHSSFNHTIAGVTPIEYINAYLSSRLTPDRLSYVKSSLVIKGRGKKNTALHPIAYFNYIRLLLERFKLGVFTIALLALAILIAGLVLIRARAIPSTILLVGISSQITSLALLLIFQSAYGALYGRINLLIGAFLIGSTLGAFSSSLITRRVLSKKYGNHIKSVVLKRWLFASVALFGLYILSLNLSLGWLIKLAPPNAIRVFSLSLSYLSIKIDLIFPLSMLVLGVMTSMAFPLAGGLMSLSQLPDKKIGRGENPIGGLLYFADMAGAGVGAAGASILLLPVLGVGSSLLIIGCVNLLLGIVMGLR